MTTHNRPLRELINAHQRRYDTGPRLALVRHDGRTPGHRMTVYRRGDRELVVVERVEGRP